MKLAIIFTCYNRSEKTEECIKSIKSQILNTNYEIKFYICDDGSTDDTIEKIMKIEPNAKIIKGTGDLFWSKGMHLAMKAAYEEKSDIYLMINDDVKFYNNAIDIMINSYKKINSACGIVGAFVDEENNISYGGRVFCNKYNIGKNRLIIPNQNLQKCDIANWNCFLVPHEILDNVGLIDNYYEHGLGDFDYSLMMKRKKYPIYVSSNYIGICNRNPISNTSYDTTLSKKLRIKKLFSVKESPIKSNIYFYYKNYGLLGLIFMVRIYVKNIINIFRNI